MAYDTGRISRTQVTTVSNSSAETTIVAADANFRLDLIGLIITTSTATAGTLTLRDSTGGVTRMILDYPNAALAPSTPLTLSFVDQPLSQLAGKNNNWTIQSSLSTNSYHITAIFAYGV